MREGTATGREGSRQRLHRSDDPGEGEVCTPPQNRLNGFAGLRRSLHTMVLRSEIKS